MDGNKVKKLFYRLGIHSKEDAVKLFWQLFKFGLTGLLNTFITLSTYYILLFLGVHYVPAYILGFILSVANAYYWNSRYVFKKPKGGNTKPFIKTFTVYGFTFLLGAGMLYVEVDLFGISDVIAPLINLCITIPLNFLLIKYWALKNSV